VKILGASKKHALSRGHLGCLGEIATINIARGCAARCIFCFARCVPGAPEHDSLLLYTDLPRQLRQELERRRRRMPAFVLFSTASDPFLGGEEVVRRTRECLEVLIERGIGLHLSTRGDIPDDVIDLLARHSPFVRVTVPLVSMAATYTRTWEHGTLLPRERLFLLQRLRQAGVEGIQVRVEPIVPFVNDSTESIRAVISAIAGVGLESASISFVHLRPGVAEQIQREAPPEVAQLVVGAFGLHRAEGLAQEIKFHHLPLRIRAAGLRRIQRIAREHGVRLSACHCQNPGIPARRCLVEPPELPRPRGEQISLLE
jgi:DNA repair photolyase